MSHPQEKLAAILTGARPWAVVGDVERKDLLQLAEAHGVAGWLPGAVELLGPRLLALEAKGLRALKFTRRVVLAIEAANIPVVVLKGQAIAARWALPASRQQSDVDVLVAPNDLRRAGDALLDAKLASKRFLDGEHMHNASFEPAERGGMLIELHRALTSHHDLSVDVEALLARRQTVATAQGPLPVLEPEDEVIYLALHAATHALERLAWLCDLAAHHRAGVDWVEAGTRARGWKAPYAIRLAWRAARELLCVPIPEAAFDALGTQAVQAAATDALLSAIRRTDGASGLHRVASIALRVALVPPAELPKALLLKVRSRIEEERAYRSKSLLKHP